VNANNIGLARALLYANCNIDAQVRVSQQLRLCMCMYLSVANELKLTGCTLLEAIDTVAFYQIALTIAFLVDLWPMTSGGTRG